VRGEGEGELLEDGRCGPGDVRVGADEACRGGGLASFGEGGEDGDEVAVGGGDVEVVAAVLDARVVELEEEEEDRKGGTGE
jgi:hypothetical protein